jgi:hypothetical protein
MYPTLKQALETLRATLAEASGFDPAHSQRRFCLNIPHPMGPNCNIFFLPVAAQDSRAQI